jgi:raffinose/stachyose/melibiose transport system substrate-binding protein
MPTRNTHARLAAVGMIGVALTVSGCAASGDSDTQTLTFSVDNSSTTISAAEGLVEAFQEANPDVEINIEARPQGPDGETLLKTRLNSGDAGDLVWFNSGSLLQSLNPSVTLLDVSDEDWVADVSDEWVQAASVDDVLYGAPVGGASAGGILYNKTVFSDLGLEIPRSWDELVAVAEKVKAAGLVPVAQTYKDSWTSQFLVLGDFFNVQAAEPDFAEQWTAGEAKFAGNPAAMAGFEHLAELHAKELINPDYASATFDQGQEMIATGAAAMYPQISGITGALVDRYPNAAEDIGFFPIPGEDAESNGATLWQPPALYIAKASEHADAAKRFLAFVASPDGCAAYVAANGADGISPVTTCTLPDDVPATLTDLLPFTESGAVASALEFVSPVKGAALPDITVAVGSGLTTPEDAAAQYDADAAKTAQQLGLPGW